MNLLLRLKPWDAHLDAFVKTKTMTDDAARSNCLDIWEEWQNIPEVSMVIYGKRKLAPKIDRGCGSCVSAALNSLIDWRNAQRAAIPKISFQGVPDMSKPKAKVVEEVVLNNDLVILDRNGVDESLERFDVYNVDESNPVPKEAKLKFANGLPEFKNGDDCGLTQEAVVNTLTEMMTPKTPEQAAQILSDFYSSMKMHELRKLAKDHKVAYSNKTKASELIELIKQKVKAV